MRYCQSSLLWCSLLSFIWVGSNELICSADSFENQLVVKDIEFLKFSPYPFPVIENPEILNNQLSEFTKLSFEKQVDFLNNRDNFRPKDKSFLLKIVSNKTLQPTTRNEAADLLRTPVFQDADQWKLYAAMVEDDTEKIINRNYAIQYMANTYEFASDPAAVEQKLYEYSKMKENSLGATALLQTFHLYNNDLIKKLRKGFADAAAKLAINEKAAMDDRVTAVCILAETAGKKHFPLLRDYAAQNANSLLKRTAIAALGERGEKEDLTVIKENIDNPNLAVKLSAREALKRYYDRFKNSFVVKESNE